MLQQPQAWAHLPLHCLLGQLGHSGCQQLRPHLLAASRQRKGGGAHVAVAQPQVPLACIQPVREALGRVGQQGQL